MANTGTCMLKKAKLLKLRLDKALREFFWDKYFVKLRKYPMLR